MNYTGHRRYLSHISGAKRGFYETVTDAVADFAEHGYDAPERLERWMREIREAAERDAVSDERLNDMLRRTLKGMYQKLVTDEGLLRYHPGVPRFTLAKVKPKLRAELDKRILASANLIKLNRDAAIEKTLQRFSGWATSVPDGGSRVVDRRETKDDIRKSLVALPFEVRRVNIDQSHKFLASLSEILAVDNGAIAGKWHSRFREAGYDYREDHKERDEHVYAVRGSWAVERGLINKGDGYTDEIERPAELPYCRCHYKYLYALPALPDDMLTAKGRAALEAVRVAA